VSSPTSLAVWFRVQQLPKWNTLQRAAFLRLSVKSLTTIFVKIIFTCKSFLKIHLTVSWLNLLPQPPRRYLSLRTNKIPHFFNILIGSVHYQSPSFSILHVLLTLYELFMPLSKTCLLHNFWALCFRQHHRGFTCTPPSFQKNLKLIICSKLWLFILQWEIPTNTHTHTHKHMRTRALFHSFDTSDATVFTSQPTQGQNTHRRVTEFFNKWHTHQQKGPASSLQVHSLCQYISSKCTQVESVSEITPVRIWAVCHTANIHIIVGLAVQGVQRLTQKAPSPQYHVQQIFVKCLKTSRCLNVQITNNF
jgi:hypothetical protein